MKIKELMSTGICCVRPETSIEEVARQMRKVDSGIIPVCNDKEEILGIITDRDIVLRYLATNSYNAEDREDLNSQKACSAADIMSQNVISAPVDMNIHDAALLLSYHKIRRLPVTSGNRLVGMLSLCDIARRPIMADEAGDIMHALSKL